MRIFVLLLFFSAVSVWATDAKNLLRNSSFELGSADYSLTTAIPYSATDFTPEKAICDASNKVHGKYSLVFPNPKRRTLHFASHDVRLVPGRRYTFSCRMKSDHPAEVLLFLRSCTYDAKGHHWWNPSHVFRTSPEWKEYTFTFPAVPQSNPYGFLLLTWNTESLHLDALRFAEAPGPYLPAAELETAFERADPVRYPGKNRFVLKAVNHSAKTMVRRITPSLYDRFYKTSKPLAPLTLRLKPGESAEFPFTADLNRFGSFELRTDAGTLPLLFAVLGELPVRRYSFRDGFSAGVNGHLFHIPGSRFDKADPDGLPKEALFGACGMSLDEFFARTRQSGFGSIRLHDDGVFYWWRTEKKRGQYDWSITDNIIRSARKNGIDILPRLGSSEFRVSMKNDKFAGSWIRKASTLTDQKSVGDNRRILPPPDAWEAFVFAFVNRYKDQIKCYEIINEPNFLLSPEEYTEYLKRAYRAAKKADPESVVVGFCATGDMGANLGKFLEDCGRLGAFQYADAISFHPYSAQLDDSPVSADKMIQNVREIVRRYRPGLPVWNSELYFIQNLKGLEKPTVEQGEFPVGNLVRRYLIDLSGGVSQSINVWAPRILGLDLRPEYKWPNYAVSTFIPNEYAAATNAFARFLECGKGIRSLNWLRGISARLYKDRNGGSVVACWAVEEGEKFTLALPEGVRAFDLFGNPIPGPRISVDNNPVYLKGRAPASGWESIPVIPNRRYLVTGARFDLSHGKPCVNVEIRNNMAEALTLEVRIPGASKQKITLKPGAADILRFPVSGFEQKEIPVILSDGEEIQNVTVRPIPVSRFLRSGESARIGEQADFRVRTTKDFLEFFVQVRDGKRGGRIKNAPWTGDGIEFFLDTRPDQNLARKEYSDFCYRLFLVPKSANGLPMALTGSPNLETKGISWTLKDSGTDYEATVRIPWKSIGLTTPASLSFDIAVDNSDGERRHAQSVWAGGPENWRNRFLFGRLLVP